MKPAGKATWSSSGAHRAGALIRDLRRVLPPPSVIGVLVITVVRAGLVRELPTTGIHRRIWGKPQLADASPVPPGRQIMIERAYTEEAMGMLQAGLRGQADG